MASFLNKPDYFSSIKTAVLDALTGGNDAIIDELSAEAVEEMKSYLNTRYDVNLIFGAAGTARNKSVVMYAKDIALYHIYSIAAFHIIPETRVNRYKKALSWLQDVNEQSINPEGLPLNTKSLVKSGSNEKRINQQL
jgi:hypothetical protein